MIRTTAMVMVRDNVGLRFKVKFMAMVSFRVRIRFYSMDGLWVRVSASVGLGYSEE